MDTFSKLMEVLRNRKGIAAVYIALILFALVGFVGLAIDIGYMYVAKGQLQNAADAGALAGAALLDDKTSFTQTAARNKAEYFAESNKVVASGTQVQIANPNDGSNSLTDTNDITVGNWDATKSPNDRYSTSRTPINAVQVRARRTSGSPGGQVQLFFARIFGRTQMGTSAQAIAVRQGLATPGIPICTQTCNKSVPFDLFLGDNDAGNDHSYAWTLFTTDNNIGNKEVKMLIDGRSRPPNDLCGKCITTDNGVKEAQNYLHDKYMDLNFDSSDKVIVGGAVVSWKIAVPVVNYNCNDGAASSGCPPSKQGKNEPYHVSGLAVMDITEVRAESEGTYKGLTIASLQCYSCPITYDELNKIYFGKRYVYLVQ